MIVSGVYALTTQNTAAVLNTGFVNIKIKTYKLNDENREVEYEDDDVLLPGEEASFIPKIVNLGAKCYLRIKIDYINSDIDFRDYVTGFSSDFVKYEDYYYYNKVFNENDEVKLFDTVLIPGNANTIANGKRINFEIIAEAVQENNFIPNYSDEDPWNGITPAQNENSSYIIDVNDESTIIIKYDNDTENDIYVPDSFLESIKNAMPGDVFTDIIEIKNTYLNKAKFFIKLKADDADENEMKLLNVMNLQIRDSRGKLLYNGKLLTDDDVFLTELAANEKENLEFRMSVPIDLTNEYSNLNPELLILFSSNKKKGDNSNSNISSGGVTKVEDNSKNIVSLLNSPKTGDNIKIAIIVFLVSAFGLIVTMIADFVIRKKEII